MTGQFAGDDPPEDYLQEEADRRYQEHLEAEHDSGPCTCPPAPPSSTTAPF